MPRAGAVAHLGVLRVRARQQPAAMHACMMAAGDVLSPVGTPCGRRDASVQCGRPIYILLYERAQQGHVPCVVRVGRQAAYAAPQRKHSDQKPLHVRQGGGKR